MKKKILLFSVLILFSTLIFFLLKINSQRPKTIHYHAGFLVYVDGKLQDFSDQKYMEISACKIVEKPHLHDNIGDVVHVHQKGAVWGDLFKNVNYILSPSMTITGYINGKEIRNILLYPIKPYNSVIIVMGENTGIDLTKYVTVEHIKEVEKKSESCGN